MLSEKVIFSQMNRKFDYYHNNKSNTWDIYLIQGIKPSRVVSLKKL